MDLEEIGINAGNWVDSAQNRNYWRVLVNAALNTPLPILIPLGPKYWPQDPVFKYPQPDSSPNVRDHVSQPYSTTVNIIVFSDAKLD